MNQHIRCGDTYVDPPDRVSDVWVCHVVSEANNRVQEKQSRDFVESFEPIEEVTRKRSLKLHVVDHAQRTDHHSDQLQS